MCGSGQRGLPSNIRLEGVERSGLALWGQARLARKGRAWIVCEWQGRRGEVRHGKIRQGRNGVACTGDECRGMAGYVRSRTSGQVKER